MVSKFKLFSELNTKLTDVPVEVDNEVSIKKLAFLGKIIDVLTDEQRVYLDNTNLYRFGCICHKYIR